MTPVSAPLAELAEVTTSTAAVGVDSVDLAFLHALTLNARQSQRALAGKLAIIAPGVADRLARLQRAGVIRGYRVDLDWAALGYLVNVYLAVTARPRMDVSDIIRAIRELPEAQEMSVVTGAMLEQMRRQRGDVREQEPQVQHGPAQGSGEVDDLVVASPAVVCWQGADPARRP